MPNVTSSEHLPNNLQQQQPLSASSLSSAAAAASPESRLTPGDSSHSQTRQLSLDRQRALGLTDVSKLSRSDV